jgi:hypothetical protein
MCAKKARHACADVRRRFVDRVLRYPSIQPAWLERLHEVLAIRATRAEDGNDRRAGELRQAKRSLGHFSIDTKQPRGSRAHAGDDAIELECDHTSPTQMMKEWERRERIAVTNMRDRYARSTTRLVLQATSTCVGLCVRHEHQIEVVALSKQRTDDIPTCRVSGHKNHPALRTHDVTNEPLADNESTRHLWSTRRFVREHLGHA